VADDVLEAVLGAQLALQRAVLRLEPAVLDRLLDEPAHDVEVRLVERLLEIPERARAQRLDRALGAAIARDDDAGQVGLDLVDLPHQLESVEPGHAHVRDDQVETALREDRQRLGGVACLADLMAHAREDPPERTAVELLVIDDEDVRLGH
jgi:hypothetical protein